LATRVADLCGLPGIAISLVLSAPLFAEESSDRILLDSAVRFDEVTVTATRLPWPVSEVPAAITAIDSDAIKRQSPSLLTDLLRGQTGVYVQQTTPGQGTPIVRGVTGSSVLMLVDGMRLNTAFFRPAPNQYFALIDPYNVDRIEVLRGSGSTLYGSDAIGGVVQVETPLARFESDAWQSHGRVLGEFASADGAGIGRAELAAGRAGVSFAAGATYQDHDDLRAGGGRVQRPSAYDVVSADGTCLVEADVQDAALWVQYLRQPRTPRYDALVAGFGQDHPESDVFLFEPNDRLFIHGRYRRFGLAPFAEQLIAHVAFQEINDDRTTRDFGSTNEDREENRSRLVGLTLQAAASWRERMSVTYGADLYFDRIHSKRSRRNIESGDVMSRASRFPNGSALDSYALYVEDELRLHPRLSAVIGGRLSHFVIDIPATGDVDAIDRDITDLTGSLGLAYRVTDPLRLMANLGRGFRVPNVFDFAQLGSRPGNRFAVPNPNLDPETAISADLGVKVASRALSAELFGFFLRVDDKIEAIPTGEVLPDGRAAVRSENVNTVDYAGVEAGVRWAPEPRLVLYGSLNYTWGEERFGDGETFPADRVPPVNGQLGLWWNPLPRLWMEPFVRYAGDQNRLSDRDRADPRIDPEGTPKWLTINARIGVELHRHLRARLTLENVLDEEYREHGSGIDAPGTNVAIALEAIW
jgi:hemoglobin/transferrin/lactoferrin receptor protein